jgi:hypothetical protein
VNDFQQILALRALVNDLVERVFAGATAYASERGAVFCRGIGILEWVNHGQVLKQIILIQHAG